MTKVPIDRTAVMQHAAGVFDDNLGDLPSLMRKVALFNGKLSMHMGIVSVWCAENPEAAARIVGAVALAKIAQEGS